MLFVFSAFFVARLLIALTAWNPKSANAYRTESIRFARVLFRVFPYYCLTPSHFFFEEFHHIHAATHCVQNTYVPRCSLCALCSLWLISLLSVFFFPCRSVNSVVLPRALVAATLLQEFRGSLCLASEFIGCGGAASVSVRDRPCAEAHPESQSCRISAKSKPIRLGNRHRIRASGSETPESRQPSGPC